MFLYWFGWMFWIIVHFFWKKTELCYYTSVSLLLFLAFVPMTIQIESFTFSAMFFPFFFFLCAFIHDYSLCKLALYFVYSLTIASAYAAFQLMIIFDPVIAIIDEKWMSLMIVITLATALIKTIPSRFHLALLGIVIGECVASLAKYEFMHMSPIIGSLSFFDKVALISMFYGSCYCLHHLIMKWKNVALHKYSLEKSS